jgi:hypothetical protein
MMESACREATLATGVRFLLDSRDNDGWWRDFILAPGRSDEWVTAYVAVSLARVGAAPEAVGEAWKLLASRTRRSGGWAFNGLAPADADSTAWGLMLAHSMGADDTDRAQAAGICLDRHILSDGAVVTYAEDGPIRRFIHANADRSFAGWCGPAACATAAVAHLPAFTERAASALRDMQCPNGSWQSYWWCADEYATALAASALAGTPEAENAAEWVLRRTTIDEPFAAALRLQTLLSAVPTEARRHAAAAIALQLQEAQRADGSWGASAWLRVPYPEELHPADRTDWKIGGRIEGSLVPDDARIFTTATVVATLAHRRDKAW